jgi:hypothetical protein
VYNRRLPMMQIEDACSALHTSAHVSMR